MKEYLLPTRVVDGVKIENEHTLFQSKGLYATINYNVKEWNQYLKMTGIGSYIVLDFGKEMNGGIRIITGAIDKKNITVRIRFGESISETCAA